MSEFIKTGDMYLAALLMSYGLNPISIDRSNPKRQKFVFVDKPMRYVFLRDGENVSKVTEMSFDEFVVEYAAKNVFFPPDYLDNLRHIRSLIVE